MGLIQIQELCSPLYVLLHSKIQFSLSTDRAQPEPDSDYLHLKDSVLPSNPCFLLGCSGLAGSRWVPYHFVASRGRKVSSFDALLCDMKLNFNAS